MGPVQNGGFVQRSMSVFNRMTAMEEKFEKLDEGDINGWILNHAMAPNPFVRYLTSMMYLSNVNGLPGSTIRTASL